MADLTLSNHSFVVVFLDATQYHKRCKASYTNKSKNSERDVHFHDRSIMEDDWYTYIPNRKHNEYIKCGQETTSGHLCFLVISINKFNDI